MFVMIAAVRWFIAGTLSVWMLSLTPVLAEGLDTAPVARADLPRVYRLDGVAEAVNRGTVSGQTSGRVIAVNFDVDDFVRQGDVIVLIEDTEHQSRVDQALATLKAASARRQDAESDFKRIQGVFAKQAVSKAEMDKATTALKQARAGEQEAEAAYEQALQQLEYTRVKAPYNGILTERLVEVGESVQPGQPLVSGLSLDSMRISVDVPQNLVESIRKERKAQVKIGANWVVAEEITIFPVADPISDTFEVRLQLPDGIEGVYPGMYTKVGFVAGSLPSLVVPLSAVVLRSEVVAVYVLDGEGRVHFRHIRLGSPAGQTHVSVLSGLDEGELVATNPVAAGILLKSQRTAKVRDE
jgi:RND family efflux transporter MFP subunit